MKIELSNKVILLTGASGGIGSEIAKATAKAGAYVVITGRNLSKLSHLASELEAYRAKVTVIDGDLTDYRFIGALFREVSSKFGKLDGFVNNAGVLIDGTIGSFSKERVSLGLSSNLESAIHCLQYAARLMRRNGQGSIINTSSIMATTGVPGQSVYSASKAALLGLTLSAAQELGPHNIRVNCISPGLIETSLLSDLSKEMIEQRVARTALKRIGRPDDVAGITLFLLSEASSFITGQNIGVDGGLIV